MLGGWYVPPGKCQVIWTITLTKENLWEFLKQGSVMERPTEVFGELELLQLLDQFFDRAVYFASIGCEKYHAPHFEGAASAHLQRR